MRRKITMLFLATLLIVAGLLSQLKPLDKSEDSIAALSQYGSSGQEVTNIQTRLSRWGYYSGDIDGLYGYLTYIAVRDFQIKNGLTADGIAGPETLAALGLPAGNGQNTGQSKNQNTSNQQNTDYASGDVNLLARLIHGEARGEPYEGKVAVGAVVLNRTRDPRFPKTLAGVIYQPGAFDAVYDGQINLAPDASSLSAAQDAMNGWDPSYGCVYYYNPNTATSSWIWSRQIVVQIGEHNFAK